MHNLYPNDLTERNKKLVIQYILIHHEGVTEDEIRAFTDNEPYIKVVMAFRKAFPDYSIFVEDITAEGEFVFMHGTMKGTHLGEFHGIPATFRKVEFPIIVKYQVEGNKILNAWPMSDQMEFMEQLGAIQKPI